MTNESPDVGAVIHRISRRARGESWRHMRKYHRLAVIVLSAAGCVANPSLAQSSPESVAGEYAAAIRVGGMPDAANYIHPDELRRFKDMLSPLLADAKSPAAQGIVQAVFGPQSDVESVAAMDPLSFMQGFLAFLDGQMKVLNVTFGDLQILGAVPEGDTVHLVTRTSAGAAGMKLTKLEVMSLKPYEGMWKVLLSGQIEALAQALNAKAAATAP